MANQQSPLFRYESNPDDELGRRLIASTTIQEGRLVFVERPFIAMQTMGNMHEGALVCNYCMAFCGSPKQALRVISDAACLQEITTSNSKCIPVEGSNIDSIGDFLDNPHALHCCRHKCGVVYCSQECQQDDWEWGGHRELCTGTIPDPVEPSSSQQHQEEGDELSTIDSQNEIDSQLDPLIKYKIHAMETNEIFLLVAIWLVRILKNDLPYNEDDNLNKHPYTDFQMNPWWDVKANEESILKNNQQDAENDNDREDQNEAEPLGEILKKLCEESHSYLSKTIQERLPFAQSSPWLSAIGMARLIGSLEQNCLGVRRKHALQRDLMEDTELRNEFHEELVQCLEGARVIGNLDNDDSSCGCGSDDDDNDNDNNDDDENTTPDTIIEAGRNDNTATPDVDDVDENDGKGDDASYSPDDIAKILASLKPDLTNKCAYDEWDDVIRPLDGVSHYSIATKMNHSCEPNVILVYKTRGWGRDYPLVAYIVALRDISAGEELTISYITSDDTYEERQAALANYGFVCKCSKCENEKKGILEGEVNLVDEEDLFGEEEKEDADEDEADEDDIFGDDEDDLFGDDEEDDGDDNGGNDEVENDSQHDDQLSGAERLSNLSERIDSILNKSNHIAIPLTCLAPVSNYIIKQVSNLLQDMKSEKAFGDDKNTIANLLEQHMVAIRGRDFASCRIVGSDLELFLYHQLQSNGSWATILHRASYWCASIVASIGYAHEGSFIVAMKYLDKAIILGQDRKTIENYFGYVEMYASQMATSPCPIAVDCKVSDFQCSKLREAVTSIGLARELLFPVREIFSSENSNEATVLAACNDSQSLVIRGLASSWPALKTWRNMDVLAREFGHRLVPIEVGSMNTGMKEAIVSFRRFVAKYLSASSTGKDCWSLDDATTDKNNHIAYLAQHPLLNQIPALCKDINMKPCGVKPTNINIWMGTGGTRTPLHFDSYDNLLVQLVGAKYVRLYKKESSSRLYVSKDKSYGGQGNMSDLDCEREDFEKHPLAKECSYTEVVLFPGDCLFIPSREWHYVRSLSTSVSVNFWF